MRSYHIAMLSWAAVGLVRRIGAPNKEFLVGSLRAECRVGRQDALDAIDLAARNGDLTVRDDGVVVLGPNAFVPTNIG